ncbi:trehalase family glycosidase [uncultured Sphaerochaeta sp.]|uniref:MGH1-like glycoside hydrolase domain-containing protein n=1 Tax=uncultured Sphaerochaeta sp. TaxID=886478 RepID=UPI002A0A890E|nr:trehalase family glycosidase [uncultured Sphaerochaeta sp.]
MQEDTNYREYADALRVFFTQNIPRILKEPNTLLKHPFMDPGSVYIGNLWDWDSYWTTYGLLGIIAHEGVSMEDGLKQHIMEHAHGNILNFLDLQMDDGYIPMMVTDDIDVLQSHYLIDKHREGYVLNMHKPFLCQHIYLIASFENDFGWTKGMMDQLEKYFSCYHRYYYNENAGLYVWADDVMIGMDNDPASFGRPRFSTANIFLNSFMVGELRSMAIIASHNKMETAAMRYRKEAEMLVEHILVECWDNRDKFFYSVDVDVKTRSYDWFHKGLGVFWKTLPIKIRTWSGFLPLLEGFATEEQAAFLVALHSEDANTFNSPFGIRTLARDEKMYDLSATNNPSNWLGPIWGVSNYAVFRGLMKYGYFDQAKSLCYKTVRMLGEDLERTGTLHEYYDPESGKPIMNGGFINWNLLVLNMIDEIDGRQPMDAREMTI